MKFEDKVRSMTIKEIVLAMIEGLENPTTKVDMITYGMVADIWEKGKIVQKDVCFGCAATNTIACIAGVTFNTKNITSNEKRAEAVESDREFLDIFESAINALRSVDFYDYNSMARLINISEIPDNIIVEQYKVPELDTETYKDNLPAWREFAEKL